MSYDPNACRVIRKHVLGFKVGCRDHKISLGTKVLGVQDMSSDHETCFGIMKHVLMFLLGWAKTHAVAATVD